MPGGEQVTHIFRDVLHGWGRVVLVTNVGSSPHDYDETVNVLKYAAIASTISTVAKSGPLSAMPLASSSNASAASSSGNQPGSAEQGPKGRPGGPKRRKLEPAEEPPAGEKGKLGTLKESGWEEDRAQLQVSAPSDDGCACGGDASGGDCGREGNPRRDGCYSNAHPLTSRTADELPCATTVPSE